MTLIERLWKYTVLGATSIVFEETNPILGGIAARHGRAGVVGVILSITIGIWIASLVLYWIGYSRIGWVRRRWPEKERLIERALTYVQRHPWRSTFAIRFAYGLRVPLPIACGAADVPVGLYTVASGISCLVWSVAFTYIGLAFGGAAIRVLHFIKRLEVRLGILVLILIVLLVFLAWRRMSAERRGSSSPNDLS